MLLMKRLFVIVVLGDNQTNSRDSRRLGLISIEQIKGKVVKIHKLTAKGMDE